MSDVLSRKERAKAIVRELSGSRGVLYARSSFVDTDGPHVEDDSLRIASGPWDGGPTMLFRNMARQLERIQQECGNDHVEVRINRARIVTQRWGDMLVSVCVLVRDPANKSLKRKLNRVAKKHSVVVQSPGASASPGTLGHAPI